MKILILLYSNKIGENWDVGIHPTQLCHQQVWEWSGTPRERGRTWNNPQKIPNRSRGGAPCWALLSHGKALPPDSPASSASCLSFPSFCSPQLPAASSFCQPHPPSVAKHQGKKKSCTSGRFFCRKQNVVKERDHQALLATERFPGLLTWQNPAFFQALQCRLPNLFLPDFSP